jgi:hypothetical protein
MHQKQPPASTALSADALGEKTMASKTRKTPRYLFILLSFRHAGIPCHGSTAPAEEVAGGGIVKEYTGSFTLIVSFAAARPSRLA